MMRGPVVRVGGGDGSECIVGGDTEGGGAQGSEQRMRHRGWVSGAAIDGMLTAANRYAAYVVTRCGDIRYVPNKACRRNSRCA